MRIRCLGSWSVLLVCLLLGGTHLWVYWRFDWTPPGPGTYLLKVKARTEDGRIQEVPDNLVLVVK